MSVKQKFIEWFTKNNNGCSPAMEDDRSFVHEKTRHMFEAYLAGVAEGEARCAALAAENAGLKAAIPPLKIINDVTDSWDDVSLAEEIGFNYAVSTILKSLPETPATDAFLDEVRAQGVDMFAKEMHADISGDDAREFAAKLRMER